MKAKYIKVGDIISLKNDILKVLKIEHSHRGRGKADLEITFKNLTQNNILKKNFDPEEELTEVEVEKINLKFLYSKEKNFYFLGEDNKKYVIKEELINKPEFIKKDLEIKGLIYNDQLISIELPIKAVFKVISAPPGIKGNSEKSNSKLVTIETGAQVYVPLFIKEGDKILINIEKGEYVERV